MFFDLGDGVVFRGVVGLWLILIDYDFYLFKEKVKVLMVLVVDVYWKNYGGVVLCEFFIYGKICFLVEEWDGFKEMVLFEINVVCVCICEDFGMKFYCYGMMNIVCGFGWVKLFWMGYLWIKGFVLRL